MDGDADEGWEVRWTGTRERKTEVGFLFVDDGSGPSQVSEQVAQRSLEAGKQAGILALPKGGNGSATGGGLDGKGRGSAVEMAGDRDLAWTRTDE